MSSKSLNSDVEKNVSACYSTWASSYYEQYYGASANYPPVHADLILELLESAGVSTLLDAGCGPASFLRHMANSKIEWHGFDLTPEMVEEGRKVAKSLGRNNSKIWVGSVLEDQAYSAPDSSRISFDGAVMIGVLPHIPPEDEVEVLRRLAKSVEPGGFLVAEARNALFGLFTLNRPSFNLFNDNLIDWELLKNITSVEEKSKLDALKEALSNFFRMDRPMIRGGKRYEPGYDEVLSRSHIPFELAESAREAGWINVEIKYCHFHILPPMFEYLIPKSYRTASLKIEDPNDWRGMIMASVFMVTGNKQC